MSAMSGKKNGQSKKHRLSELLQDEHIDGLHGWKKVQHILIYYKVPLVIICILLYIIGYNIYGRLTHKDTVLYTALVNVVAGEALTEQLSSDFVNYLGLDDKKNKLTLYTDLYLTDDELNAYHEYTYASRIKILAALESKQLDVILMNQEAFDAFSQNGYLYDLDMLLSQNYPPVLHEQLSELLVDNIVILEDNSDDMVLDNSLAYSAVTETHAFGLDMSKTGLIRQAGFEDTLYLGIAANAPHVDTSITYLQYLLSETP